MEYIVRQKIYDSVYWKQHCFGLSAERLVDKAVELKYVGGMYGEPQKASEFVALILKMLQIQPDKEIIVEFIKNDDFKYLRLLGRRQRLPQAGWACRYWPSNAGTCRVGLGCLSCEATALNNRATWFGSL